jgi:TRAP-type C4-dicarboxylate transport system permease large subunit
MMSIAMFTLTYWIARRRGYPVEPRIEWSERWAAILAALLPLAAPLIVVRSMSVGLATPTEAAAIAAAYAFLVAAVVYRALSFSDIRTVMHDSVRSSASVGLIIGSALIFNYIVASENIPAQVSAMLKGIDVSPLMFMVMLNVLFLVLGCCEFLVHGVFYGAPMFFCEVHNLFPVPHQSVHIAAIGTAYFLHRIQVGQL